MTRQSKVWGGQWSITKLDSVEEYLRSYLKVMKSTGKNYGWDLVYIDAFCGSGSQHIKKEHVGEVNLEGKEIPGFVLGSTMRALSVTEDLESIDVRGFSKFYFIDSSGEALEELKTSVGKEHPRLSGRCYFVNGDTNIELPKVIDSINWSATRGVIFIDPFRANFDRQLLEKVASTLALDVWFLFPLSAINRMMARDGGRIPDSWAKKLDKFYGSHEWYERLYTEVEQPTLFDGFSTMSSRSQGCDELLLYTEEWLKGIFGPGSVLDPLRLDGANNSPLFALFSAISSRNTRAIDIWKRITKHIIDHA